MRTISATILDATHLELSQPLAGVPGQVIEITLREDDELAAWRDAGRQRLLDAYDEEDAVYDDL